MRRKYNFEVSTPVGRIDNMLTKIECFCLLFIDAMKTIAQTVFRIFLCHYCFLSETIFTHYPYYFYTLPATDVIVKVSFKLFVVLKLVFGNGSVIWCYTIGAS